MKSYRLVFLLALLAMICVPAFCAEGKRSPLFVYDPAAAATKDEPKPAPRDEAKFADAIELMQRTDLTKKRQNWIDKMPIVIWATENKERALVVIPIAGGRLNLISYRGKLFSYTYVTH